MDQVVYLTTLVEYLWHVCVCAYMCVPMCVLCDLYACALSVHGAHVHLLGCFTLDICVSIMIQRHKQPVKAC